MSDAVPMGACHHRRLFLFDIEQSESNERALTAMQKLLYRTDEEGDRLSYDHAADCQLIVAFVPVPTACECNGKSETGCYTWRSCQGSSTRCVSLSGCPIW